MEFRGAPSKADESRPSLAFAAGSSEDPFVDEFSRKMLSWSGLWFGSSASNAPTQEHFVVRERILSWLECCIGRHARTFLTSRVEDISLANSSPLLTAFLGRRAMLELSRRVLNDS